MLFLVMNLSEKMLHRPIHSQDDTALHINNLVIPRLLWFSGLAQDSLSRSAMKKSTKNHRTSPPSMGHHQKS